MRKIVLILAAAMLAACTSTPHPSHWNPNAVPRDETWHSQTSTLLRYDANHDGTLTRAELLAGLHAEYNTYDTAHTNCLGPDQSRAINEMRVQQDASPAAPLVDWNQDNCIAFNESAGNTLSLIDTLATYADGQLTLQDLNASGVRAPGQGGQHGGGGHGRGH